MKRGCLLSAVPGLAVLILGACGTTEEGARTAGDECSSSELDKKVCGKTKSGQPAVLECQDLFDGAVWATVETCSGSCSKGACVAGGQDGIRLPDGGKPDTIFPNPDGWVGPDGGQPEVVEEVIPVICDPGTTSCAEPLVKSECSFDGTEWTSQPCEEGFGCDAGFCLPQTCIPGEQLGECFGPTAYSQCAASGVKFEPVYCSAGQTCYKGACVAYKCNPGDVICKGMTAVQECKLTPDGISTEWEVVEICEGGICVEGKCISACEVSLKDNSYLGCDYFAVDLDNVEGGKTQLVAVVVSLPTTTSKPADVTITNMGVNPPVDLTPEQLKVSDMQIQPGQLKTFMLPGGFDIEGSEKSMKSFRVRSSSPVTVHQFNPLNGEKVYTNDASLLLPANVGGNEYIAMSWPLRSGGGTNLRGFVTVIATEEGVTTVQVYPTAVVLAGNGVGSLQPNGQPNYFELNQGEILNLETDGAQGADLTGTRINANKKINVFGGHECANIPLGTNYCDHVESQLFPLSAWGNHYVADAFYPRNGQQKDVWRIMSGADGVQVTLNPMIAGPYTLNKGQFVEFASGESFEVNATGPVSLGHYLQGSNYAGFSYHSACQIDWFTQTGIGDPAFTLGIPTDQFLSEYIVLTPDKYLQDYLNIMVPKGSEGLITLDGLPLNSGLFKPVGSSEYSVAQLQVQDGVHTIKSTAKFGVTAYGYDCDVSYAYPGGLSLKKLQ